MAAPVEDAEAVRALQTLDEDDDGVTDEEELQLLELAEVSRVDAVLCGSSLAHLEWSR